MSQRTSSYSSRIEPEDKVGVVSVRCIAIDKQLTEIEVTYQYTTLGKKGEEFIDCFTSSHYQHFIHEWKRLLVSCFDSRIR